MITFAAALLVVGVVVFTLTVRKKDLPEPEAVSPTQALEDRKAAIYENLRDLQFEHRLGKLSDEDYQQTKQDLQRELAIVVAELEKAAPPAQPAPAPAKAAAAKAAAAGKAPTPSKAPVRAAAGTTCPHCGAEFSKPMKFCGECGKSMLVEAK